MGVPEVNKTYDLLMNRTVRQGSKMTSDIITDLQPGTRVTILQNVQPTGNVTRSKISLDGSDSYGWITSRHQKTPRILWPVTQHKLLFQGLRARREASKTGYNCSFFDRMGVDDEAAKARRR